MKTQLRFILATVIIVGCSLLWDVVSPVVTFGQSQKSTSVDVLVLVDGKPITSGDLNFMMLSRRVPRDLQPGIRKRFTDLLIDQRLMQAFLNKRKIIANQLALDRQVDRIVTLIKKNGKDPNKVLSSFGYSEETLRQELALPLAWQSYVKSLVTQKNLREYWDKHRQEFDGTEVRAAHILLKITDKADAAAVSAATKKLDQIAADIAAGQLTFVEAAKQFSQAPSADDNGDLGFFPYRGKMAVAFSQAAFPLKKGEISKPFQTPFGMHLITVTDRRPGQLSLEDVRDAVFKQRADELWSELVAQQRAKAKIEWKTKTE